MPEYKPEFGLAKKFYDSGIVLFNRAVNNQIDEQRNISNLDLYQSAIRYLAFSLQCPQIPEADREYGEIIVNAAKSNVNNILHRILNARSPQV